MTADLVIGPKQPSMVPVYLPWALSSTCRAVTAEPVLPSLRVGTSAAQVAGPVTPSAERPRDFWNAMTVLVVPLP